MVGLPQPAVVWLGYLIPELALPFVMAGAHTIGGIERVPIRSAAAAMPVRTRRDLRTSSSENSIVSQFRLVGLAGV